MAATSLGLSSRHSTRKIRVEAALFILFGFALITAGVRAQEEARKKETHKTFVYTNNNDVPNTVTGFSVGPDGALTMLSGTPVPTGGNGVGTPFSYFASNTATAIIQKSFLYVSNSGTNNVSGFSIDASTGALTPVPGSPFATGGTGDGLGISLAVTPNGKFLYAGNGVSNNISAFSVGPDGTLSPLSGSPFAAGDSPDGMKVSPNGKFLAVALVNRDSVAMFSIGHDGALAPAPNSPFSQQGTGGGDVTTHVDISCDSKQLFAAIGNFTQTEVGVSTIASDGELAAVTGSPFTFVPGVNSNVAVLSPNNEWLFVSNQGPAVTTPPPGTITSLSVQPDGTLAQVSGSPFLDSGAVAPSGMATNAEGTLLYVANRGDSTVTGFSIDNRNGSLSPVAGGPFLTGGKGFLESLTVFPARQVEGEGDESDDGGQRGRLGFPAKGACKARMREE